MTDPILESLAPNPLWKRFFELKDTPRPSKREGQVIEHLIDWAKSRGFEFQCDKIGNLCVQVPASSGCEQAETVILQNHVDIVVANAANAGENADAARGLIPVARGDFDEQTRFTSASDGRWIYAPLTTLGADNGIGCASAMAVCEMKGLRHPPLELLFTVDEEEGMSGALQLDPDALGLTGKTLINLDTEDDDELTIGSAGGCDVHVRWKGTLADAVGWTGCSVSLAGLRGGHSGIEINSGRANAIRLMARALREAGQRIPMRIVSIDGGDRRNAIPRSCDARILIEPGQLEALQTSIADANAVLTRQYDGRDHAVNIRIEQSEGLERAFSVRETQALIDLLLTIPAGVFEMTAEIPDLPETSNNLALIATRDAMVEIDCSCRSSFDPGMQDVLASIHSAARAAGAELREGNSYPGWKPNVNSKLLASTRSVYERLFDEKPKVLAVHAGLECGVLSSNIADLDCISFGPNIRGNHAPGEHVEIASVDKSFRLLVGLLEELT